MVCRLAGCYLVLVCTSLPSFGAIATAAPEPAPPDPAGPVPPATPADFFFDMLGSPTFDLKWSFTVPNNPEKYVIARVFPDLH